MKALKRVPATLTSMYMLWSVLGRSAAATFGAALRTDKESAERGDVPGWVMITLMSAVLVAGLLAIAGPALEGLFRSALDQVNQSK